MASGQGWRGEFIEDFDFLLHFAFGDSFEILGREFIAGETTVADFAAKPGLDHFVVLVGREGPEFGGAETKFDLGKGYVLVPGSPVDAPPGGSGSSGEAASLSVPATAGTGGETLSP